MQRPGLSSLGTGLATIQTIRQGFPFSFSRKSQSLSNDPCPWRCHIIAIVAVSDFVLVRFVKSFQGQQGWQCDFNKRSLHGFVVVCLFVRLQSCTVCFDMLVIVVPAELCSLPGKKLHRWYHIQYFLKSSGTSDLPLAVCMVHGSGFGGLDLVPTTNRFHCTSIGLGGFDLMLAMGRLHCTHCWFWGFIVLVWE